MANGNHGFYLLGARQLIQGNVARLNTQYGFAITGDNAIADGNKAYSNGHFGLYAGGVGTQVTNNSARENSTASNLTYNNIQVVGNYSFISGNTARRGSGANRAAYGIYLSGTGSLVGPNDTYDGGTTADWLDAGTSTRRLPVSADWAAANELARISNVAAAGTGIKVPRNDHVHAARLVPYANLYADADQTINITTWTSILWNKETSDLGGWHSTSASTEIISLPEAGLWYVLVILHFYNIAQTGMVGFTGLTGAANQFLVPNNNASVDTRTAVGIGTTAGAQNIQIQFYTYGPASMSLNNAWASRVIIYKIGDIS